VKIISLLAIVVLYAGNAIAQNTFPSNGNVGIGTISPAEKLEVNGFIRADGIRTTALTTGAEMVYIRGTGYYRPANRIVKLGKRVLVNNAVRGLCFTIIDASTHAHVSSIVYDTYMSTSASDALATALDSLTYEQIGILTSWDAFEMNITSSLRKAAQRLGLYKLAGVSYNGQARRSYAAIFYGDGPAEVIRAGRQAIEICQPPGSSAPFAAITTWMIEDGFIGQELTNALISADSRVADPAVFVNSQSNVGIGTTSPSYKLSIVGGDANIDTGYAYRVNGQYALAWDKEYNGIRIGSTNNFPVNIFSNSPSPRLTINTEGNIGIGTPFPQSKLAVNGTVTAKQVKVTQTGWPDYVFDSSYVLPDLSTMVHYLKREHHLPGVPSALEIENNGLNLGDMQKLQAEKIEQILLYLIEQKELIRQQGELLKRQQAQIDALRQKN
jgi:hypothetical protein